MSSLSQSQQAALLKAVETHLLGNTARVSSFVFEGQHYWIKQVESVKGRTRFLKPAPKRIFQREMRIHEELETKGVPVPEMLVKTAQFVVFEDAGSTLESYWRDEDMESKTRANVSNQAAKALAQVHASGVSHGRPVARDICWNGKKAMFLDFENYSERRNGLRGHAFDLLCFVHSVCSQPIEDDAALAATLDGYRQNDNIGVWEAARVLAHRLRWIEVLSRPIQARKDPHAKEFKSLPKVREIFA